MQIMQIQYFCFDAMPFKVVSNIPGISLWDILCHINKV